MLSVIIPVFNEAATLPHLLAMVSTTLPAVAKEIIVVDDGSSDGTREWLRAHFPTGSRCATSLTVGAGGELVFAEEPAIAPVTVRVFYHQRNSGKGAALQTGLASVNGDVIVIQDADLEYDPADWAVMYDLIAGRKVADVVYGSRFYGRPHRSLYFHHYLANRLISLTYNLLYNQTLTDIECCYKMFTREVKERLHLTCNDFGCEIQISAQIALTGRWRIYETGISYFGRTYEEGKKIGWRDGVKAIWYLARFRFSS